MSREGYGKDIILAVKKGQKIVDRILLGGNIDEITCISVVWDCLSLKHSRDERFNLIARGFDFRIKWGFGINSKGYLIQQKHYCIPEKDLVRVKGVCCAFRGFSIEIAPHIGSCEPMHFYVENLHKIHNVIRIRPKPSNFIL